MQKISDQHFKIVVVRKNSQKRISKKRFKGKTVFSFISKIPFCRMTRFFSIYIYIYMYNERKHIEKSKKECIMTPSTYFSIWLRKKCQEKNTYIYIWAHSLSMCIYMYCLLLFLPGRYRGKKNCLKPTMHRDIQVKK